MIELDNPFPPGGPCDEEWLAARDVSTQDENVQQHVLVRMTAGLQYLNAASLTMY